MGASIDDGEKTYLTWEEMQPFLPAARSLAFKQLVLLWQKYKDHENFLPFWGDEIEYTSVLLDHEKQSAVLSLSQKRVLEKWKKSQRSQSAEFELHPEAMQYMFEMVAAPPLGPGLAGTLQVEKNLEERRRALQALLGPGEFALTLSVFPRLGAVGSTSQPSYSNPGSLFSHYRRWAALGENIQGRRGRGFEVSVPLFQDINTPQAAVVLDDSGYATGGCALQVTMQGKNIEEACRLHDQMAVLGPLMLAMTAATPGYRGYLADTDVRWDVLRLTLDDRNPTDVLEMEKLQRQEIDAKLRASTGPIYLSANADLKSSYQSYLPKASETQKNLKDLGMNENLAAHFAHFLQYDPLLLESGHVDTLGPEDTYHFRSLYRSAWPHVRLKIPEDDSTGWRVEFRPMEVQLTDFENAAFIVFMVLLRHTIDHFKLNLYIPMHLLVENMQAAVKRDAILHEKFWCRSGDWKSKNTSPSDGFDCDTNHSQEAHVQHLSLRRIVCGPGKAERWNDSTKCNDTQFPGFIPLVEDFLLKSTSFSMEEKAALMKYVEFIKRRASGQFWTNARWMRHAIQSHPTYQQDSIVSPEACYDLLCKIKDASQGVGNIPGVFA